MATGTAFGFARLAADRTHLPGRTMTGKVFFLIFRDRVVAHACEEVVGIVIFAHMFETKSPIFVGAQAALRRTMRRGRVAARPLAGRQLGAEPTILIGLDPDPIKERRVTAHRFRLCGCLHGTFKT